jgi:nucleotide-binding universal stress UspA family protein
MSHTAHASRILVGVDGSVSSIGALRGAAKIAGALGAPIEAITTWEFPILIGEYYPADWSPEEDAKNIRDSAIAEAFPRGCPVVLTRTSVQGSAARVLIEQSTDAYMLVLGSRGHGGFAGLLLGSVSAACAAHAHCPVLIMHDNSSTKNDN